MIHTPEQTTSETPILSTKLHKPNWRSGQVPRPNLLSHLDKITERRLAIITAPAGFGKTTLLSEWIHNTTTYTCWVSLNETDNDPIIFWSYVIASIQRMNTDVEDEILSMLLAPQSQPLHVVTTLLNALSGQREHLVLILDDYHLIESTSIHEALAFFIEHAPPHVHTIISTRTIPPLPLARLRARNELTEIEALDLRFSFEEATQFLKTTMNLDLKEDAIHLLETKTEGWIAGLQLAALSLNGREDAENFIQEFSGDDRYIVDYLAEEVLHRHPNHIRQFLLYTSILEHFNSALCDAVTDQTKSPELLEALELANLFLVPLDNKRNWFRYHHLFGEVLQSHLQQAEPGIVPELHRRACEWHESNDSVMDAIHHALAGQHLDKAQNLIEQTAFHLFEHGQNHTLYKLLDKLPAAFDAASPILTSWYAWRNIDRGDFTRAARYLEKLERYIDTLTPTQLQELAKENHQYKSLPGILHTARAMVSQASGDVAGAISHAKQAIELLPQEDTLWIGGSVSILGLASWSTGDLDTAFESFRKGIYMIEGGGINHYRVSGAHVLAEIRMEQGRFRDTHDIYNHALKIADTWKGTLIRGTADLYYGLSELAIEHNELEEAIAYFSKARSLGKQGVLHENVYRQYLIDARIQEAQGLVNVALERIQEAEENFIRDAVPNPRPIEALKIRLLISTDNLPEAVAWAKKKGFQSSNALYYLTEFEHIAFTRILMAQYRKTWSQPVLEDAITLLHKLEQSTSSGGRIWNLIVVHLLHATCLELQSNTPQALEVLQKALQLGERDNFIRTFLDEGSLIHNLLRHAVAANIGGSYARNILSAFEQSSSKGSSSKLTTNLLQPLTPRELEIIRLIAAGMRNQEIADHLFISLSTVKRHIANAYGKLEATHRTEAINQATKLGLI